MFSLSQVDFSCPIHLCCFARARPRSSSIESWQAWLAAYSLALQPPHSASPHRQAGKPRIILMPSLADAVASTSRALDERVSGGLKRVHRRLQALAKVLVVTTFFEDALRVLLTFSVQQNSMRIAGWQSPLLHTGLPALSFVVQSAGALLTVMPGSSKRSELGCYVLLSWCLIHPIMYRQETNVEFVLETLTIMGGLLILLSHCMLVSAGRATAQGLPAKAVGSSATEGADASRAHGVQAIGRVMIMSIFLYYAFQRVHGYTQRVLASVQTSDWTAPIAEGAMIVALLYLSSLVIVGIKSRWVALLLAVGMFCSAVYMHPFWIYVFSTRTYRMEGVAHMEGFEVDAFTMGDHQRYFFFQTMSTVGALLLLMVHGPGKLSMDEQQGSLVLITAHDA